MNRFKWRGEENFKLGDAGNHDTFSGIFLWRKGGDIHSDILYRRMPEGTIHRQILVVRSEQGQAEQYDRVNDAPLGYSVIQKPKDVDAWGPGILGRIFLIDKMKQDAINDQMAASVHDDQIEGRPLKVLEIGIKLIHESNISSILFCRYWIDLHRSGHVVRVEYYASGNVMQGRLDITLTPFKIGDAEVWMPVRGDAVGYGAIVDKRPVVNKEPTSFETIYVVAGTMQFNKRPGREAFTIKYKPGTPVSDNLRKLKYEFGQQKIGIKPTKAAAGNR
ncbi:MAG: hypothetical protein WKF75_07785 [Singulisphaera sp.]